MIKFILIIILFLFILFNIQSEGELIQVKVKIKDDWKGKREFIYLKNFEIKKRFVLNKIEKNNNQFASFYRNIDGYLSLIELNPDRNIFKEIK
ncbi:unnamed protein product [Meloidogyne enterolobii]|uniref:Uncharacterized protein n=1 Tax=Meloidogyne enterolobii TaxID=390850 RepID=A0ACB0ZXT7_MELEN